MNDKSALNSVSIIEVLDKAPWIFSQDNMSNGGLIAQVTKCKINDVIFYVRENVNGVNSFEISSGERWGDKAGSKPSRHRQVLELYAPEPVWEILKKAVEREDGLKRKVFKNRNFNEAFVTKIFT